MDDYTTLMLSHAQAIVALVQAGAVHDPLLHLRPEAVTDKGLMTFCPGCELTTRVKRLHQMQQARDDTHVKPRLGGKSKRDQIYEQVLDAQRREEPDKVVIKGIRPR